MEEKIPSDELEEAIEEMKKTEMSFLTSKAALKGFLDQKQNQRDHQTNQNRNANATVGNVGNGSVKLPKLEVPKFDGTFVNWATFRDLFLSMVGNKKEIPDGEKLLYLKPNCSGEAEDIIAEYQITDANYEGAWAALEERFDNKRLQVKAHLDQLFDQPVMATENVEMLRLLLRTTQKCIRALRSLGGQVDQWDWLLVHITVMRLDPKTRRYWELIHTSKEVATWDELVKALDTRCIALESEKFAMKGESKAASSTTKPSDKKKASSSSTAKVFTSISSKNCGICNGSHDCSSCKTFLGKNLEGRLELVHQHKLCYKCLKPNHNFLICKAAGCGKCTKRHHELLHNSNQNSSPSVPLNNTNSSKEFTPMKQPVSQPNVSSQNALVSGTSTVQTQVLLSTALVKVRSMEGNWVILRAFLDGGAQRM